MILSSLIWPGWIEKAWLRKAIIILHHALVCVPAVLYCACVLYYKFELLRAIHSGSPGLLGGLQHPKKGGIGGRTVENGI